MCSRSSFAGFLSLEQPSSVPEACRDFASRFRYIASSRSGARTARRSCPSRTPAATRRSRQRPRRSVEASNELEEAMSTRAPRVSLHGARAITLSCGDVRVRSARASGWWARPALGGGGGAHRPRGSPVPTSIRAPHRGDSWGRSDPWGDEPSFGSGKVVEPERCGGGGPRPPLIGLPGG